MCWLCCVVLRALGESKLIHMHKYNAVTCVQAALIRRRRPKHACLQIVL